jgi:hypothetical protein
VTVGGDRLTSAQSWFLEVLVDAMASIYLFAVLRTLGKKV